MGIKYVKLLWIRVGDAWRARACRDCPPYILKEVCDDIYGADNWCIAWDLAYDRQALDDAKTNIATAIKGARMVFNPLVKKGITVVACLEGQNCGDYYDGRFPKRGYRASGGKRLKVQFDHEKAVVDALTRKGLEVSPAAGCCGELNAARLIGTDFETEIHGAKLCVLGKSADSDALVVMRQVLTVDGDEGDWW